MDDDSFIINDSLRANWTPSQDQYFIDQMLDQVRRGNKTGHVLSKQAWAEMIAQFNTKFGFKYDTDVLKNRYKRFRKQYNEIKMLVDQSGFKWDETLHMVIADDNVWAEFIKAHPDMVTYRTRVVPHYNELCIICGHAVADGRYSLSCFDVDFEKNDEAKTTDVKTPKTPKTSSSDDHPKIDWSQTMDQFFVELMLDQVHKGNKIGRMFKKKAWAHMIMSFNTKFGFQYGKVVLKNRYNILRRHYGSIMILLTQKGFSWDETQQKVVGDDRVWNKYLKAHHNFRMFRNKVMPYYSEMSIICGNEATTTKNNTPSCKSRLVEEDPGKKNINGKAVLIDNKDVTDNAHKEALHSGGDKKHHPSRKNEEALEAGVNKKHHHSIRKVEEALDSSVGKKKHHSSRKNEAAFHSGGDKNVSEQQKRLQPDMPQTFPLSKKARRIQDGMADVLREMAVAVTSLTKKQKQENSVSTEDVIDVLQAIPDMDDDLLLDACDFLEDEKRARMFLALDAPLRKKWLMRKLRP